MVASIWSPTRLALGQEVGVSCQQLFIVRSQMIVKMIRLRIANHMTNIGSKLLMPVDTSSNSATLLKSPQLNVGYLVLPFDAGSLTDLYCDLSHSLDFSMTRPIPYGAA
jgi:hypothetical protein